MLWFVSNEFRSILIWKNCVGHFSFSFSLLCDRIALKYAAWVFVHIKLSHFTRKICRKFKMNWLSDWLAHSFSIFLFFSSFVILFLSDLLVNNMKANIMLKLVTQAHVWWLNKFYINQQCHFNACTLFISDVMTIAWAEPSHAKPSFVCYSGSMCSSRAWHHKHLHTQHMDIVYRFLLNVAVCLFYARCSLFKYDFGICERVRVCMFVTESYMFLYGFGVGFGCFFFFCSWSRFCSLYPLWLFWV